VLFVIQALVIIKPENMILLLVINLSFYIKALQSCSAESTEAAVQMPHDF
jgi:hypothetical protein